MKIVIDLDDTQIYGLSPGYVFKQLRDEHNKRLQKEHGDYFFGMATACEKSARELYAQLTRRSPNVKNLILTYNDAEACFKIYEKFVDVWVSEITC